MDAYTYITIKSVAIIILIGLSIYLTLNPWVLLALFLIPTYNKDKDKENVNEKV